MPGAEHAMNPEPQYIDPEYKGSGKLKDKVAIITGGDSGIGRSVAVHYAREGADVVVIYLEQHKDAEKTKGLVEKEGRRCLLIAGDVGKRDFCFDSVKKTIDTFGKIDILVNHAGTQVVTDSFESIKEEDLVKTFRVNVFSQFFMCQAALPHMKKGASIINTSSVNSFKGNDHLIDYSASKGANTAFTYSLAQNLYDRKIRVNSVAPGPIWTPFIPGSFPPEKVKSFGKNVGLGRAGQPDECAPAYVFLASELDSSYITGQTIHPNGGTIVSG
jgi:NAD(P)-dependent dehydrogenase (short-subunit alcohol dehydrogenase family)